jgi:Ca2+-binding RTX toxin-like protein
LERRLAPACTLSGGNTVNCDGASDTIELRPQSNGSLLLYTAGYNGVPISKTNFINAGGGFDKLIIQDGFRTVSETYTHTNSFVQVSNFGMSTTHTSVDRVENYSAWGGSNVVVRQNSIPIYLYGGAGNEFFFVSNGDSKLDGIGIVNIFGTYGGQDAVYVADTGTTSSRAYTITNEAVTVQQLSGFIVRYSNVDYLYVGAALAPAAINYIAVLSTSPGTETAVDGGNGLDFFYIGKNSLLDGIHRLALDGEDGTNSVYLYDTGYSGGDTYTISAPSPYLTKLAINGLPTFNVTFEGHFDGSWDYFLLSLGNGANVVNIQGTPSTTQVSVAGGSAGETFNVGSTSNTLDTIKGPPTLYGYGGSDKLYIHDEGSTSWHTYKITANSFSRTPGAATIGFHYMEYLYPYLGPGSCCGPGSGHVVDIESTDADTPVELNIESPATVNIGNPSGSLDEILGSVTIDGLAGAVDVRVNDQGAAAGQTYTLKGGVLTRSGAAAMALKLTGSLEVNGAAGGNLIDVEDLPPDLPTTINSGAADDLIRMRGGPILSALSINGQGGNNRLGYSAYTTGVYINLKTGQGTDVAGFSGIENLTGGQGDDIIVGNNRSNSLIGQGGRDLLIGAGGDDTIDGGGADDIVIGGSTAHDIDEATLKGILATWAQDSPYRRRINQLSTLLNPDTVTDDGVLNTLTGGAGMDWFFVNAIDLITDHENGEIVTGVGD